MKSKYFIFFLFLFGIVLFIHIGSAVDCNADLSQGGTFCTFTTSFVLNNGIYQRNSSASSDGYLIMGASNIVVDLNGSTLLGNSSNYGYGLYTKERSNITIKNGIFKNYKVGVKLGLSVYVPNITLDNITFINDFNGLLGDSVSFNNSYFNNLVFINNSDRAILINPVLSGGLVFNNISVYDTKIASFRYSIHFIKLVNSNFTNIFLNNSDKMVFEYSNNILINNFVVNSTTNNGLDVYHSNLINIFGLSFKNIYGDGVNFNNVSLGKIHNSFFYGNGSTLRGVYFFNSIGTLINNSYFSGFNNGIKGGNSISLDYNFSLQNSIFYNNSKSVVLDDGYFNNTYFLNDSFIGDSERSILISPFRMSGLFFDGINIKDSNSSYFYSFHVIKVNNVTFNNINTINSYSVVCEDCNGVLFDNSNFYLSKSTSISSFSSFNVIVNNSKFYDVHGGITYQNLTNGSVYNSYMNGCVSVRCLHFYSGVNNFLIDNLSLTNGDIGIDLQQEVHDGIIRNSYIDNMTTDYDGYGLSVRIWKNVSRVVFDNNHFERIPTCGLLFRQNSSDIIIKNNYFSMLPFSFMLNVSNSIANENEPPSANCILELYKTYTDDGNELFSDNLTNRMHKYASNNYTFLNNTFDSSVQVFLRTQGTTNVNQDFLDFWFRSYQYPSYLVDKDSFWISNLYNNVSLVNFTFSLTNLFGQGYLNANTNAWAKILLFKDYEYYKNTNSSIYGLNLYGSSPILGLQNALIYFSNNSVACSNINSCDGNINITLSPQDTWSSNFDSLMSETAYAGRFNTAGDYDDSPISPVNTIISASAKWNETGKPSGSYFFNGSGTTGARIVIQNRTEFSLGNNGLGKITVCQWIKPNTFNFIGTGNDNTDGSAVHFTSKYDNLAPGFREWYFRIYNDTAVDGTPRPRRISFYLFNNTGSTGIGASFQDNDTTGGYSIVQPDMWIHVCGVANGTEVSIYRDGVKRNNASYNGQIYPNATNVSLRLGGMRNGGTFNGTIDEVFIFNRSLNSTEIYNIYQEGLNGHNVSNFVYVLDNFNLIEGVSREHSPLWFAQTSLTAISKTWHIASNISSITNVPTILNLGTIKCSNIKTITMTPKNLASYTPTDYSCSNGILTINDANYETSSSSNQIIVTTFQIDQGFCSATMTGFSSFFKNVPTIAYLLGILLIVSFIVGIVYIVNNGVNFELPTLSTGGVDYNTILMVIFAIGLVGIIAVISIVAMNAFCVI